METLRACSLMMIVLVLVGCAAATPPSRLGQYVSVASTEGAAQRLPTSRPVRAALVVLADRPAPESPAVIPEAAQDRLASMLGELISQGFPLRIECGESRRGSGRIDPRLDGDGQAAGGRISCARRLVQYGTGVSCLIVSV